MEFLPNYDNPGPERDLPRKTGIFRLWETLSRDFWDLFRAGFLALLGCAPFLLGVAYSLSAHVLIYAPAGRSHRRSGAVRAGGHGAPEPGRSGHCIGLSVGNGAVLPVSGATASGDQSLGPGSARPLPDLPRHQ